MFEGMPRLMIIVRQSGAIAMVQGHTKALPVLLCSPPAPLNFTPQTCFLHLAAIVAVVMNSSTAQNDSIRERQIPLVFRQSSNTLQEHE